MSLSKKRILTNASFKSQFNCSLMCYTHENNNKIIRHRERYLKTLRNDKQSSFNALLEKPCSVSIHERNIIILVKEMFKVSGKPAPHQMHEILHEMKTQALLL